MSESYGGPKLSNAEQYKKFKALNLKLSDFVDFNKDWVLVENGSLLGYFDWVPEKLRVGPWSPLAPAFLFVMVYVTALCQALAVRQGLPPLNDEYPEYGSPMWYYNLICFLWMCGFNYGRAGFKAMATYSMWTWLILEVRHGLSAAAPWLSKDGFWFQVLEYSRFPALIMTSMTFFTWNFVLMPLIYFFMKSPERRKQFLSYFTSFRLIQIHVFNLPFAFINGLYGSPRRALVFGDLVAALSIAVVYFIWYLFVLDRLGIHIYPLFSPRSKWVIPCWSLMFAAYGVGFLIWRWLLSRFDEETYPALASSF